MTEKRLQIEWLNKNDRVSLYAKYCMMELARTGEIDFVRIHPSRFDRGILSESSLGALSPAQSFFVARLGDQQCKVILDCSESFFYISQAIKDVDLYFFTSYNRDLFREHRFFKPYHWQSAINLSDYESSFGRIEDLYGKHFHKIIPFIPYPMSMAVPARMFNKCRQIYIVLLLLARNVIKRLPRTAVGQFDPDLLLYRLRYELIKSYRSNQLRYDVVLRDTLFAWPLHRIMLHRALKKIVGKSIIASISTSDVNDPDAWWRKVIPDGEISEVIQILKDQPQFTDDFEKMITSSRLSVFATGKHWGWRGITFLSLMCGGPILMDVPVFEPYFPISEFILFYNHREWKELDSVLDDIDDSKWQNIRRHNQQMFDKYLAPLPVARYVCQTLRTRMAEPDLKWVEPAISCIP